MRNIYSTYTFCVLLLLVLLQDVQGKSEVENEPEDSEKTKASEEEGPLKDREGGGPIRPETGIIDRDKTEEEEEDDEMDTAVGTAEATAASLDLSEGPEIITIEEYQKAREQDQCMCSKLNWRNKP